MNTEKEIKHGVKKILNEDISNIIEKERKTKKLLSSDKYYNETSEIDILIVDIENLPSLETDDYKCIPEYLENIEDKFITQKNFQLKLT